MAVVTTQTSAVVALLTWLLLESYRSKPSWRCCRHGSGHDADICSCCIAYLASFGVLQVKAKLEVLPAWQWSRRRHLQLLHCLLGFFWSLTGQSRAGGAAGMAVVTTQTSAVVALLTWLLLESYRSKP